MPSSRLGAISTTTLPDASVDFVVAGQAFHWFDPPKSRKEFARILRPSGWVALIWNERVHNTPFLQQYEGFVRKFGTDYKTLEDRGVTHECRVDH